MTGIVNAVLEATLPLEIHGPNGQTQVTAVIDTGYNGSLSLPMAIVALLAFPPLASRSVTLGDGSRRVLDFYEAEVVWDGQLQSIPVLCVDGDALIGTALLKGYTMEVDFIVGGLVRIVRIP
jgi:clan AA aspartic protease